MYLYRLLEGRTEYNVSFYLSYVYAFSLFSFLNVKYVNVLEIASELVIIKAVSYDKVIWDAKCRIIYLYAASVVARFYEQGRIPDASCSGILENTVELHDGCASIHDVFNYNDIAAPDALGKTKHLLYASGSGSAFVRSQAYEAHLAREFYAFHQVSEEHEGTRKNAKEYRIVLVFEVIVDFLGYCIYRLENFFIGKVEFEALVVKLNVFHGNGVVIGPKFRYFCRKDITHHTMNPLVSIIMGSTSDLKVMEAAAKYLEEMQIPFEVNALSAHRTPEKVAEFAKGAAGRGIKVIIAGAGGAAHLPGVIAASTNLPVIGVPIRSSNSIEGLDSILSILQMPSGIPVATMALDGAKNAAIFAVQILSLSDAAIREKSERFKSELADKIAKANNELKGLDYKYKVNG